MGGCQNTELARRLRVGAALVTTLCYRWFSLSPYRLCKPTEIAETDQTLCTDTDVEKRYLSLQALWFVGFTEDV